MEKRHVYIITSERAYERNDEWENELHTNRELSVGDTIVLDGLLWTVVDIVK